jgi:hypothetical protein
LLALGEKPEVFNSVFKAMTGSSACERAVEIAPDHPIAPLMRRGQDSNIREVRQITYLRLKIKRHAWEEEALANPSRSLNVNENKSGWRRTR